MSIVPVVCRYCGKELEAQYRSHNCISSWRDINSALGHEHLGRQARKATNERTLYHELCLAAGVPSTLHQLGMTSSHLSDTISQLRRAGVPIHARWQTVVSRPFGLRVRQRVYWLSTMLALVTSLLPLGAVAAWDVRIVRADAERILQCNGRANLVRLAAVWAAQGLERDKFHWTSEDDTDAFARGTRREVDTVWSGPAQDPETAAQGARMRCLGTEV
jgi:hypothetical protein